MFVTTEMQPQHFPSGDIGQAPRKKVKTVSLVNNNKARLRWRNPTFFLAFLIRIPSITDASFTFQNLFLKKQMTLEN